MTELRSILDELLTATHASRVTLRRDDPGDYAFPVVEESLSPGIGSLREERTVDLRTQPVVHELVQGRQVVQDDCRAAFDDPAFHAMLVTYGGLAAQIVTPVVVGEKLEAIVSVHHLGTPRAWMEEEIAAARQAASRVGELLSRSPRRPTTGGTRSSSLSSCRAGRADHTRDPKDAPGCAGVR